MTGRNEQSKSIIRVEALARRDALPAAERQAAAEAIVARGLPVKVTPGLIVSGFAPIKTEINPLPLMRKFMDAGARLALPVVQGRGRPLVMRAWTFGDALKSGQWGIREPLDSAAEVDPDVLLMPLAAFDRGGHRIGYGAGYYDMTLARLRDLKPVTAIGLAFAAQEIPEVPATGRDERLDLVLTERETLDWRGV